MKTLLAMFGLVSLLGVALAARLCAGVYAGYCARLDTALASAEAFQALIDDLRRAPAAGLKDRASRPPNVRAGLERAVELYNAPRPPWRLEAVEPKGPKPAEGGRRGWSPALRRAWHSFGKEGLVQHSGGPGDAWRRPSVCVAAQCNLLSR
jgi:hypothetical protein